MKIKNKDLPVYLCKNPEYMCLHDQQARNKEQNLAQALSQKKSYK